MGFTLHLFADDFRPEYLLGNEMYAQGKYDVALRHYLAAEQSDPTAGLPVWGEANCLYLEGQKVAALGAYRRALRLLPDAASLATRVQAVDAELNPQPTPTPVIPPSIPLPMKNNVSWVSPLWRSAILPGWGQAYNGQNNKMWLLGGVTWVSYAGVAFTYVGGSITENEYSATTNPSVATAKYNEAYNFYLANQTFYIIFGFAYLYQLVDAALNAGAGSTGQQATLPGGVQVAMLPQGALLRREWTW